MKFRFPIVIIDEDYRSENTSGLGIRALAQAIETEGFEVLGSPAMATCRSLPSSKAAPAPSSCRLTTRSSPPARSWTPVLNLRNFIQEVRRKNLDVPIYVYGETKTSRHMPNDILRELHGFIHMFEDTPEFVARHIIREAKSYLEGVQPPFFKALLDYAEDGSYSLALPRSLGRRGLPEEPGGPDVPPVLWREHAARRRVQCGGRAGPAAGPQRRHGESERNAARIFNADHCFFVTNGTSTSNKMVWHHTVAPGDVVVVDRNCHKSILHSIIMTGAIPVFLKPTRNHFGIIGPDPARASSSPRPSRPRSAPTRCSRAWMRRRSSRAC
jgi:arginine decarboxylase